MMLVPVVEHDFRADQIQNTIILKLKICIAFFQKKIKSQHNLCPTTFLVRKTKIMVTRIFFLVKRQIFSPVTIIALLQLKQKGLCRTTLPRRHS